MPSGVNLSLPLGTVNCKYIDHDQHKHCQEDYTLQSIPYVILTALFINKAVSCKNKEITLQSKPYEGSQQ